MAITKIVKNKMDKFPQTQQNQVLETITQTKFDKNIAILSETSLNDWNKKEEEEAWKNYQ